VTSKNAFPNNSNNNTSRSKREITKNGEEAVLESVKGRWMQLRGLPREEWT